MVRYHTQDMPQVLLWSESVGRVFPYLQQESTSSGQQWSAFLQPQWISLDPYLTHADQFLSGSIAHTGYATGAVMV